MHRLLEIYKVVECSWYSKCYKLKMRIWQAVWSWNKDEWETCHFYLSTVIKNSINISKGLTWKFGKSAWLNYCVFIERIITVFPLCSFPFSQTCFNILYLWHVRLFPQKMKFHTKSYSSILKQVINTNFLLSIFGANVIPFLCAANSQ